MRTISYLSSKASWRLMSLGWCSWFMMLISFFTVYLSRGYGVLMNLATNTRPVDFSMQRWTTPKAPLETQACKGFWKTSNGLLMNLATHIPPHYHLCRCSKSTPKRQWKHRHVKDFQKPVWVVEERGHTHSPSIYHWTIPKKHTQNTGINM